MSPKQHPPSGAVQALTHQKTSPCADVRRKPRSCAIAITNSTFGMRKRKNIISSFAPLVILFLQAYPLFCAQFVRADPNGCALDDYTTKLMVPNTVYAGGQYACPSPGSLLPVNRTCYVSCAPGYVADYNTTTLSAGDMFFACDNDTAPFGNWTRPTANCRAGMCMCMCISV